MNCSDNDPIYEVSGYLDIHVPPDYTSYHRTRDGAEKKRDFLLAENPDFDVRIYEWDLEE